MYLTRHSEKIKGIDLSTRILIAGAGSIGSYSALALAKLGFTNLIVADDGLVEEENIAPQFYRPRDIGKLKVNCLKQAIKEQTGAEIIAVPSRIEDDTVKIFQELLDTDSDELVPDAVIILAVDSMVARKFIHRTLRCESFVDARMAIEFLTIISFGGGMANRMNYINSLFSDEQAVQEPCTNKAIAYTSMVAGGLVAKAVLDRLGGAEYTTVNFDLDAHDMVKL